MAIALTQGDVNRLSVRVTANGVTPVVIAAPQVTARSVAVTALFTTGGTPATSAPGIRLNPGVGFSLTSSASDTSVYNVVIL